MLKVIMSFFMSDIIAKGIAVIFLPIFAYFLGAKELGLFAEWFSSYNILLGLFSFGVSTYILVLLSSSKEERAQELKNQLLTFFIKWLILIVFIFIFYILIFNNNYLYFSSIAVVAIAFSFIQIYEALLRFYNKTNNYLLFQIFLTTTTSVIPLLCVLYNNSWESRALGVVISIVFLSLFSMFKIFKNFKFVNYEKVFRNETIKFGIPIFLISSVMWIKLLIDLKLLKLITSTESSGILFFTFQILSIISILSASLNRSSTPIFFKLISEHSDDLFLKLIIKLTLILIGFSFILICLVHLLLHFELSEYQESIDILYPMVLGVVFYSVGQFFSSKFLFFKKTYINALCIIFSSVIHPFLTYYIIKNFYWTNIGYSYLISNFIFFLTVLFFFYSSRIKELQFVKE